MWYEKIIIIKTLFLVFLANICNTLLAHPKYNIIKKAGVFFLFYLIGANVFGQSNIIINPGGGAGLTDGLKVLIKPNGSLHVYRENKTQYYNGFAWGGTTNDSYAVQTRFAFERNGVYQTSGANNLRPFVACNTTPPVQNGNDWTASMSGYVTSPFNGARFFVTMFFSYTHPNKYFTVDYYIRAPFDLTGDPQIVHVYLDHDAYILGHDGSRGFHNVNATGEIVGDYRNANDFGQCSGGNNNPRYPSSHGFKASSTGFRSYYTGPYGPRMGMNAQLELTNIVSSNCQDDGIAVEFVTPDLAAGETAVRRILHCYGDFQTEFNDIQVEDKLPPGMSTPVTVNFTSSTYSEAEGNNTHLATAIQITVIGGAFLQDQSVNFTISGGTAIQGTDFTYVKGFIIPIGDYTTAQTLTLNNVTILGNQLCQVNRSFNISIDEELCNDLIAIGSQRTATYTIIDDDPLSMNQPDDQIYCSGDLVSATTFSSPLPNVIYSWTATNGTAIGLLSNSGTGNLPPFTATNTGNTAIASTITVMPAQTGSSCDGTNAARTFTITIKTTPSSTITANPMEVCPGGTSTLTATVSGGTTTSMTYTWYEGTDLLGTTNENTYNLSALTTTANYLVEVTNSNGCSDLSNAVVITVFPPPDLVTGLDTTVCPGTPVLLEAEVTNVNSTITWFSDPHYTNTIAGVSTITVAPTTTTVYYVEAISEHNCSTRDSVRVTVHPLPDLVTDPDTIICSDSPVDIGASVANMNAVIVWYSDRHYTDTIAIANTITVSPNTVTVYYVEALSEYNCSTRDSILVAVYPLPNLVVQGDTAICYGETINIGAMVTNMSSTVTWYSNNLYTNTIASANTITVAPTTTTVYYVEAISENNCSTRDSVVVTVHPLPNLITVPDITECYNTPVQIGASVSNVNAVITWFTDFYITPIVAAGSITVAPATNTVYYVEAISDKGCSTRDSVRVSIKPLPDLITGPAPAICFGESVEIGAEATNIANTITWYSDPFYNNIIAESNTITVSPFATTDFYVVALSTEGCKAADVVTVTVHPLPVLTANNLNICAGDEITVSATTNDAGDFIRWYRDALYIQFIQAVSFNTVPISDTVFYVEAESIYGCISRDSVAITLTLPPQVRAMDDLRICYDDEITLTTTIADGVISWNVLQTNIRLTASTYYIVTASRPPCPDVRDTVRITVGEELYIEPATLPPFRAGRLYNQQLTTNAESPHTFTLISSSTLPGGITLQGNGLLQGIPTIGLSEDRDYLFTVQALDPYGCFVTKTYIIRGEFYIPSVFSPDGDGINDHFMEGYKVVIFDRLGVKIFEGDDGWDGTCKGKVAPVDTYFYILFYRDAEGKDLQEKGSITLLR